MDTTFTETTVFIVETCCQCGIQFGIPKKFQDDLRSTGDSFYCPGGHGQHYSKSTEAQLKETKEKLKQAQYNAKWWMDRAEEKAQEAKTAQYQAAARKGQLTKIKKRIANGACPCCHRQFVNLQRHMAGQHPSYVREEPQDEQSQKLSAYQRGY